MGNESLKLGISFLNDKIRFIEAEELSGFLNIISVVESDLPAMFDYSILGDESKIPQFAEIIDKTLDSLHSDVKSAKIAIDRKVAMKKTFAVDKNLTKEDVRSQIEWELEQLLIAPRDEYNAGFEHIILPPNYKNDIVVFVIIRKALVNYLVRVFQKTRLSLDMLDIDLFSSIRALKNSIRSATGGMNAMVDIGSNSIGLALMVDGNYAIASELPSTVGDKQIRDLEYAHVVSLINQELEQLAVKIDNTKSNFIEHIYLTGESCSDKVVEELTRAQTGASISVVNPFQNIHRQLNIEAEMLIEKHPERFTAAVGMML